MGQNISSAYCTFTDITTICNSYTTHLSKCNSNNWSLPVVIIVVGLSLPTHLFLDGVMVMLYSIPHSRSLRSQLLSILLQLCLRPSVSTADTV